MQDKIVETLAQVDFGIFHSTPTIDIYGPNQIEYPRKYVARIYDFNTPTDTFILKDTLEELQEDISTNITKNKPKEFIGRFIERTADDDPSLIGFWI